MTYKRTTCTDELRKKHFTLLEDNLQTPTNKSLTGAAYYSNTSKDESNSLGEIKVLSLINESTKITEITFLSKKNDYSKNYNEVFKQMVNFFNNQQSFKSKRFKTDVAKFTNEGNFYYAYKTGEIPVIVISDKKLEDTYFSE